LLGIKPVVDRLILKSDSIFMATVPAFEAKTKFGELLDRVVGGEEIIITRHEKPVARLMPEGSRSLEEIRRAAEGLEALRKEIAAFTSGQSAWSWKEFKSFVEHSALGMRH
jgi:prevent-host-death family protein